jgi:F-type H+-transporting ATPase subunit b
MAHHGETTAQQEFETSMEVAIDGPAPGVSEPFYADTTFWVAVSFTIFVLAIIFVKVPAMIGRALDARGESIASQLEEARKLREDAQALLASYERQQREAEDEAQGILDQAQAEAERATKEAQEALAASIARREAQAQDKIAQAEANAVKEVRDVAVEVAVATSRKLIAENLSTAQADALVDNAIGNLRQQLN